MPKIHTLDYIKSTINNNFPNTSLEFISSYKNVNDAVYFIDELNIKYKTTITSLLNNHTPSIRIAINKQDAITKKLNAVLPSLTILSKYLSDRQPILVMDELDIIYQTVPSRLLQGFKPGVLVAVDKTDWFIKKSKALHNQDYDYSKVSYINNRTPVILSCPVHGEFIQTPRRHFDSYGCPMCNPGNKGWGYSSWSALYKKHKYGIKPTLYIVKLYNGTESFIKIGKTLNLISTRLSGIGYSYTIIRVIQGSPKTISELERELHFKFKHYKYIPNKEFSGMTECFTTDIL